MKSLSPINDNRENLLWKQDSEQPSCPLTDSSTELLRDMEVVKRVQRNIGMEDIGTLLAVENVVHLLRAYNTLYEQLSAVLAPYELSLAKYNLLIILKTSPEHHLPMSEIGERMSVTGANITKLVDGLEREGLVARQRHPEDRRVVLAELTPLGLALMERLMPIHYQNVRKLWLGLNEAECLQMTHLMMKLRESMLSAAPRTLQHCAEKNKREAAQNHENV